MIRGTIFVVSASLLVASVRALAGTELPTIDNFQTVTQGAIYRGSRPGVKGMAELARMGIRTDLNLDDDRDIEASESQLAESLGIRFVSYPMTPLWRPKHRTINAILSVLADPSNYPVYIHCQRGMDRTGLLVGLHRVFQDRWTPGAAYEEMLRYGFHPEFFMLKLYFDERTGYEDGWLGLTDYSS